MRTMVLCAIVLTTSACEQAREAANFFDQKIYPLFSHQRTNDNKTRVVNSRNGSIEIQQIPSPNRDDGGSIKLLANAKEIASFSDTDIDVRDVIDFDDRSVVLFNIAASGVNGCPGTFFFVVLERKAEPTVTEPFGNCNDAIQVAKNAGDITVTIPSPAVQWKQSDVWRLVGHRLVEVNVVKAKTLSRDSSKQLTRIVWDASEVYPLKGTIEKVSRGRGFDWELALEKPAILLVDGSDPGDPGVDVYESLPIDTEAVRLLNLNPGDKGSFMATVSTPTSGIYIDWIEKVRDPSVLQGRWDCNVVRNGLMEQWKVVLNGMGSLTFSSGSSSSQSGRYAFTTTKFMFALDKVSSPPDLRLFHPWDHVFSMTLSEAGQKMVISESQPRTSFSFGEKVVVDAEKVDGFCLRS